MGSHDQVFQVNDTPKSPTSAKPVGSARGTPALTAAASCLAKPRSSAHLCKLLKYTCVTLTTGAAVTCRSGILFPIDPFQPEQKWVILVRRRRKKKGIWEKHPHYPSYYPEITWGLYEQSLGGCQVSTLLEGRLEDTLH